jgi:peptide/nickel transport system permease protein
MGRYTLQRLLAMFPVLAVVAVVTFSLIHITPGDPVALMAGDEATPEQKEAIRKDMGLDKPIYQQLAIYFADILRGDLGESIFNKFKVTTLIAQRLEPTIFIAIFSQLVSIIIAIPLGILAAWKANTWIDRVVMVIAVLGLAIPSFWLGANLIWVFAVKLHWFPAFGYIPISEGIVPWIKSITLPSISVGFISAALIARMTRASMLEVLREDYIRTARSKGLHETIVIARHALKNAFLPVLTVAGFQLSRLIGGAVIIEVIFVIPGVGSLLVNSVLIRDYPIVQSTVMLIAVVVLVLNLAVDLAYGWINPRIRYG